MRNVVLVDIGLQGHRLSFNRTFSKILLTLGCRVFLLVPESSSIAPWIKEELPGHVQNFVPIDFAYDDYTPTRNKAVYILKSAIKRWRTLALRIREIEKEYKLKIDLVFFSWIDNHLERFLHPLLLDAIFPWNWSGLYFHPYHLRLQKDYLLKRLSWRDRDSPFLSKKCIGICVHDRAIAGVLQLKRYRKNVYVFAETADCTEPNDNHALPKHINKLAKGRTIVGLIGCEPHKGLKFALDLASEADPAKYFFLFAGNFPTKDFSKALLNDWQDFESRKMENCYWSFGSIKEGGDYNAVFSSVDIHLLCYENFVGSSNRLTKAAFFKRFVLTDNHYCIGDDVKAYDLGEVVPSMNQRSALDALDRLRSRIQLNQFPVSSWRQYELLNSELSLFKEFKAILSGLPAAAD